MSCIVNYLYFLPSFTDDPYYCGLRARVPNFVKASKPPSRIVDKNSNYISNSNLNKMLKEKEHSKKMSVHGPMMHGNGRDLYHHHQLPPSHQQQHYNMWHAKSYESGIGKIYY